MRSLEDFLRTHQAGTILDIACGNGAFTRRLTENLKSYISITGLDIKESLRSEFLDNVQQHNVTFITSTIHDYLNSPQSFDTISISNGLHHLEGVGEVLCGVRGILNAGGTIIINELYRDNLTAAQRTQYEQHCFMAKLHRAGGEYHGQTYSRSEIHGFIASAGLRIRHAIDNTNADAPVSHEPGRLIHRARLAMDRAYPEGPTQAVAKELERLMKRNAEIGIAAPPQLILVCEAG